MFPTPKDEQQAPKLKTTFQQGWASFNKTQQENDYMIAKWYQVPNMGELRLWTIKEYYTALEEILKESDRQAAKNKE